MDSPPFLRHHSSVQKSQTSAILSFLVSILAKNFYSENIQNLRD